MQTISISTPTGGEATQPVPTIQQAEGLLRATVSAVPEPKPADPAPSTERPAWLPEKFKNPEDLAKSYKELEAKLGAQPAPKQTPPATAPTTPSTEQMQAQVKDAGLDFDALSKEYVKEGGKLTEATLKALNDKGIKTETVNAYIEGQKALVEQRNTRLAETVGGKDAVQSLFEWARVNLTPEQIAAADAALAGPEAQAALVLRGLQAQYVAANGSPPKAPVTGVSAPVAGVEPFGSSQEVSDAMNDPRYKRDEGFRNKVYARLAVSQAFGNHRY